MSRSFLQYLFLLSYTLAAGVLLIALNLDSLSTLFLLILFPLAFIWRRLHMHSRLLIIVGVGAMAMVAVFETVATVYGIWYTVPYTIFGGVGEAFLIAFLEALYIIALYEYLCDDRKSAARLPGRAAELAVSGTIVGCIIAAFYIFPHIFISYAFMITLLSANALLALIIGVRYRVKLTRHVKQITTFLVLWLPIGMTYEAVAIANNLRIYGNPDEYLGYFLAFGNIVPYEAILLLITSPLWIVTLYELHVDD